MSYCSLQGQKFLGVNCGTNDASVVELTSKVTSDGFREYRCNCKNTVNSGAQKMYCYIHYWECPVWRKEETGPREYESRIAEIFQQDLSDYFHSLSLAETVSYATIPYENSVCSFLISRLFLFRSKGGDANNWSHKGIKVYPQWQKIFNFFNAHLLVEPNQQTATHKVLSQNLLPLQLERFILQNRQYTL